MSKILDRVQVGTSTTGTGTMTLGPAAIAFQTFAAAGAVDGEIYSYLIIDGNDWELGFGTYTAAGTTLTRNLVQSSTSALLNLSGAATVAVVESARVGTTGGWQLITEKIFTTAAAGTTFSSIPQVFRDLRVIIRGRGTDANLQVNVGAQINSDVANHYIRQFLQGTGTTVSTNIQAAAANIFAGHIPGSTATASYSGAVEMIFYNCRDTNFFKMVDTHSVDLTSSGVGEVLWQPNLWISTAAITDLSIFPVVGNFAIGTVVSLYGQQ